MYCTKQIGFEDRNETEKKWLYQLMVRVSYGFRSGDEKNNTTNI